jgi:predicted DNA binding CopG/RHH family protein
MARNNSVKVRFTPDEIQRVKQKADMLGLPIATFIRLVALDSKIEPA